jgi:hypothetical protein
VPTYLFNIFQIRIVFEHMELEKFPGCTYDNISISTRDGIELFQGCKYPDPPYIISNSSSVNIKFMTDSSLEKTGFSLFYESRF